MVADGTATPTDPVDVLEHEFAVLFRRARSMSATIARQVHPDVEPAAYALLVHLQQTGGARLTDLASFVGVGKPTVSRQVKFLEGLGLVERVAQSDDRRESTLRLTPEGESRVGAARGARRQRFRSLVASWPPEDVELLGTLLHRFNELQRQG